MAITLHLHRAPVQPPILFVVVTALASAITVGFSYAAGYGTFSYDLDNLVTFAGISAAFAVANSVVLTVLAWRGRNRPLSDGTVSLNVLLVGFNLWQMVTILWQGPLPYADAMPMFFALLTSGLLAACIIPAHIIAVLALGRTPLLRGLTGAPKAKGPAEASP